MDVARSVLRKLAADRLCVADRALLLLSDPCRPARGRGPDACYRFHTGDHSARHTQ